MRAIKETFITIERFNVHKIHNKEMREEIKKWRGGWCLRGELSKAEAAALTLSFKFANAHSKSLEFCSSQRILELDTGETSYTFKVIAFVVIEIFN